MTNNPPMPRPSQQIDQALLASGRALLPEVGCAGLSVRALADHAGVAPGMFHYHFGSKDRFLRTLLSGLYEEMYGSLAAQVAQQGEPLERLRGALHLLARFARQHRRLLARLWADAIAGQPAARDFFRDNAPRHIGLLMALVQQARAEGTSRELPPLTVFSFLFGAIALPTIFVGGLVDAGFAPPGGAPAFDAQVMSDAAIEARIDLALGALAAPSRTRIRRTR
jgi:AcrR family transcriptional regulator